MHVKNYPCDFTGCAGFRFKENIEKLRNREGTLTTARTERLSKRNPVPIQANFKKSNETDNGLHW